MKDQYPHRNILNEQQENGRKHIIFQKNRNSTKRYKPIASRNKFQPIYTETRELKEDDAYTNDLLIDHLETQNKQRPSL